MQGYIGKSCMVIRIVESADTMSSVMLSDVSKMFTHTLPEGSFCVPDILLEAEFASDEVNDVIRFAGAVPNGVVAPPCNRASYPIGCI